MNSEQKDIKPTDNNPEDVEITLEGQDGSSYTCKIIDIFDYDDKEYVLLLNTENADDDKDALIIMRFIQQDNQSIFQTIETEEEFERVRTHIDTLINKENE